MKKIVSLFVLIAMLITLSVPVSAADSTSFEVERGVEFTGIPEGYTYLGSGKYDARWRVDSAEYVGGVIAAVVVGMIGPTGALGVIVGIAADTASSALMGWIQSAQEGDVLYGYYYDYIYECDDPGIYPYIYFHHLKYYSSNHCLLKEEGRYEFALLPRLDEEN